MNSVAIFCGASEGYNEMYRETAYQLGAMFAEQNITVIYGGARVGLMGAIADGVLNHNGTIKGIIPDFLRTKEIAHEGLTELILVKTMHERKLKMHEMSDAVIVLPGGWGTMDEMFEMLTWGQMGLHQKPIALLNINGFYDSLNVLMNNMVQEGFLNEYTKEMLLVSDNIEDLLQMIDNYVPPEADKVIKKQTT